MVVIDLTVDENAQEIFETLNARGAQLTAADLIKNFVFQRLLETGADVEDAYQKYWKEFETGFWETEVSVGRLRYPRSSIFLNHWLIARTGEEVVAREVFDRVQDDSPITTPGCRCRTCSSRFTAPRASTAIHHGRGDAHRADRPARALRLSHGRARERSHQAARAVPARPGTAGDP